jgi:hypothetical protein
MLTPLNYSTLEWGWSFSSEQCPEGMVGVEGQQLRYVFHFHAFSISSFMMINVNALTEAIC